MVLTLKDYVGFKCSTLNVSQNKNGRFWIDQCRFQTMPIPNIDINQWVKKNSRINQT